MMARMDTHSTDYRLAQVEASLGLEGLTLDGPTRALSRRVAEGEISPAQVRATLVDEIALQRWLRTQ